MDITAFFTAPVTNAPAGGSGKIPADLGPAPGALNFMDIILTRLIAGADSAGQELRNAQNDDPAGGGAPIMTYAQAAMMGLTKPAPDETAAANSPSLFLVDPQTHELKPLPGADLQAQIAAILNLNQQAVEYAAGQQPPMVNATADANAAFPKLEDVFLMGGFKNAAGKTDVNNLAALLQRIEKMLKDGGAAGIALVNLSPQQITQIQADIRAALAAQSAATDALAAPAIPPTAGEATNETSGMDEEKNNIAQNAAWIFGVIQLTPAPSGTEITLLPQAIALTPRPLVKNATAPAANGNNMPLSPAETLAARLNALNVGGDVGAKTSLPESFFKPSKDGQALPDDILKTLAAPTGGSKPQTLPDSSFGAPKPAPATPGAATSALLGLFETPSLLVNTSEEWRDYYDALGLHAPGLNLTGSGNAANLLTGAPAAASPLPAAQMVAALIQRGVADGVNKSISLQLDPPELGRVEVRFSFGKDKSVKAVVMAERPETVSMLQRDSHVLERALTSAGLDADSSSLSFELAGDGHFSGGGDSRDGNSGGNASTEDADVITAKMNWFVDPETGMPRYDLLI